MAAAYQTEHGHTQCLKNDDPGKEPGFIFVKTGRSPPGGPKGLPILLTPVVMTGVIFFGEKSPKNFEKRRETKKR